jgi:hypothetical protein
MANVQRDEIPGGMWCENLGHEPVFVRSHSERRRIAKERGLTEAVYHVGIDGTDKAPHTQSFNVGSVPGRDLRVFSQLTPEEQAIRHQEWVSMDLKLGII